MKKTFIRILIVLILLSVAICILIYKQPVKINKEFTAHYYGVESEYENETVSCVLELEYQRYLFKNNEVHGSIFIDGKKYYSNTGYTTNDGKTDRLLESKGFWEELKLKISGTTLPNFFYTAEIAEKGDYLAFCDDFLIFDFDSAFEYFTVVLQAADQDSLMRQFYGPAETKEEAKLVMRKVFPE